MNIIAIILTLIYTIGSIAFGVFLIKSWLDFGAPIASIHYDPEKWEQEKRIIEGLAHAENCRLRWEDTWHNLSGTPIDQDAHNQYLKNRACHTQLMEKYGKVYYLKCESRVEQELGKSGSNAAKDMTKQARQGADQGGGLDVR